MKTFHTWQYDRDDSAAIAPRPALRGLAQQNSAFRGDHWFGARAAGKEGESKKKAARISNAAADGSKSAIGHIGGKSHSYDDWNKEDLVKRAKEVGIKGRSTMKKAELVKALRHH